MKDKMIIFEEGNSPDPLCECGHEKSSGITAGYVKLKQAEIAELTRERDEARDELKAIDALIPQGCRFSIGEHPMRIFRGVQNQYENHEVEVRCSKERFAAERDALKAQVKSPRIYTRCLACQNDTLTINDDRHLLCTWINCPDPTAIDKLSTLRERVKELEGKLATIKTAWDSGGGFALMEACKSLAALANGTEGK